MHCVYLIRNLIDGKVYVGLTKDFEGRKRNHLSLARRGSQRYLYRAIRAHGEENFAFEVLEEADEGVIAECEQYWVAFYDAFNPQKGYNLTTGGEGVQGHKHSAETIARIRGARARQVITIEHRQHIGEALRRSNQREEVRASRRRGQAKRPPCTDETRAKRAKVLTGIVKRCSVCQGTDHNKRTCKGAS